MRRDEYRLVIAGSPDIYDKYWRPIREEIRTNLQQGRVLLKDEFIADEETEVYFKAADVLILPYRHVYQSGVLFLGHSFGLPVIAADVGSLKDDIVEGQTGFLFHPEDPDDLARAIERYFASDLYAQLASRRAQIRGYATARHSWDVVSDITTKVYAALADDATRSTSPTMLGDSVEGKPLLAEASMPIGQRHQKQAL
jgi:glycosyltransferase involved in cell wall biosynthesis